MISPTPSSKTFVGAALALVMVCVCVLPAMAADTESIQLGARVRAEITGGWSGGEDCVQMDVYWKIQGRSNCQCSMFGWIGRITVKSDHQVSAEQLQLEVESEDEGKGTTTYVMTPRSDMMFRNGGEEVKHGMIVCLPKDGDRVRTNEEKAAESVLLPDAHFAPESVQSALRPMPSTSKSKCEFVVSVQKNTDTQYQYQASLTVNWDEDGPAKGYGWYLSVGDAEWPTVSTITNSWGFRTLVDGSMQALLEHSNILENGKPYSFGLQQNVYTDIQEMTVTLYGYSECGGLTCYVSVTDNTGN
eukprot:Nk52_evm1s196 gene=Nk52_evmTU1s196